MKLLQTAIIMNDKFPGQNIPKDTLGPNYVMQVDLSEEELARQKANAWGELGPEDRRYLVLRPTPDQPLKHWKPGKPMSDLAKPKTQKQKAKDKRKKKLARKSRRKNRK